MSHQRLQHRSDGDRTVEKSHHKRKLGAQAYRKERRSLRQELRQVCKYVG